MTQTDEKSINFCFPLSNQNSVACASGHEAAPGWRLLFMLQGSFPKKTVSRDEPPSSCCLPLPHRLGRREKLFYAPTTTTHTLTHRCQRARAALEMRKHLPRDAMKRTQSRQKDAARGRRHLAWHTHRALGARTHPKKTNTCRETFPHHTETGPPEKK